MSLFNTKKLLNGRSYTLFSGLKALSMTSMTVQNWPNFYEDLDLILVKYIDSCRDL